MEEKVKETETTSGWRGRKDDGRGTDLGDHQGDNIDIHRLSERVPLLNKSSHFEQLVGREVGKQSFNHKFVSNGP